MHCGGGSFKSQFRRADASGAFAAVVLGEDEVAAGEATVKWLRGDEGAAGAGQQQRVPMERLAEVIVGFVQDEG
jgi:histidyl-tRNA synthetase